MNDSNSPDRSSASRKDMGFSPWQRLKTKNISYLTLPLLVMATITEFVILATGWKYQQVVCLPKGMGVTFFGIGPIGATILAVELLKLPLAIWTASRHGKQKLFMVFVGLPCICVLTFQLVKDMAVYEMGVAMTPASQILEKATAEETKISQLKAELAGIEQKKTDREQKLAELTAKRTKAKADLEEELKRNEVARQDAISLTDYQKKELSEVDSRQATIIKQFNADADQLNKTIAELRARRETELPRATEWNAEEARIENDYKTKLADYTNKKTAYEKEKAEYDRASLIKRALMNTPVDPGVPPVRETNTKLKPAMVADLDAQIKAKEDELTALNKRKRDAVAQVDTDARQLRQEFDQRSSTKREESDKKREELIAAKTKLDAEFKQEEKDADQEVVSAVQNVDGIRAQLDAAQKRAEELYEEREAAIRNTQVHRIATTVEIVRGLLKGQRPTSIKASAKERGDILTDQISMVRISVYPVLAFIVAFLPTLMVEIGFSTLFHPEAKQRLRPTYRLGFLGRRLHWLYIRAGRQKILRAERLASEATGQIASRDRAVAAKDAELKATRDAASAAAVTHEEQLKNRETEWVAKFTDLADSLNKAVVEKDTLRDLQKSEVERQIQMRQNAWSDRLTQMRQELDDQRAASESERTAMMQEHHRKLMEVTEDSKAQVIQARRQMAEAEMSAVEKTARLTHEMKQVQHDRDEASAQFKLQADTFAIKLSQVQEDAAHQLEKATREEKHRAELQQLEFEKKLNRRDEEFESRLRQREQELSIAFEARLVEEKSKVDQKAGRSAELQQQLEVQAREFAARLKHELQQKEQAFDAKLKQREQEWAINAENQETELQRQWASNLRIREEEWARQAEARVRDAETRMSHEAQQKEELFLAKARQRDQEWQLKTDAARAEAQTEAKEIIRRRDLDAEVRMRELEANLRKEMQQKEEAAQVRIKQREIALVAQMSAQAEAQQAAAKAEWDTQFEVKTRIALEPLKVQLARTEKERDDAMHSATEVSREMQSLEKRLTDASSFLNGLRNGNGKHSG
jgi:hypothetical protein